MEHYPTLEHIVLVNKLWKEHQIRTKRELSKQLKEDLREYEQWSDIINMPKEYPKQVFIDETLEFLGDKNMLNKRGLRFTEGFYKKYKNKMYPKPSYLPSKDGINKKILYRRRKR